jgi:hypothetical protein
MGWATFWVIFSQTHLVTLVLDNANGAQEIEVKTCHGCVAYIVVIASDARTEDPGLPDLSWCNIPKRENYAK